MVGGDAQKLFTFKDSFAGDFVKEAASYAVAVAETNAANGENSCLPNSWFLWYCSRALIAAQNHYNYDDEQICNALFTATGIGW